MKLLKWLIFLFVTANFFASAYLKYGLGEDLTTIQAVNMVLYPIFLALIILNLLIPTKGDEQ